MLAEFDQAKHELATVRNELAELAGATHAPKAEIALLKWRAGDLFSIIFSNSPATKTYLADALTKASIEEVLQTIDGALKVSPPVRYAWSSEGDRRTIESLVDVAILRSPYIKYCVMASVIVLAAAVAALGYNVVSLNAQADAARKIVDDARMKWDQAERQLKDFEAKRQPTLDRIEALNKRLDNPEDSVNKVVARFDAELGRLSDLSQDWTRRREKLAAELAQHDTFLSGKEQEVTRKTTAFTELVAKHTDNIQTLVERARILESGLAVSESTAKSNAATIAALVAPAQANATALENLAKTGRELYDKIPPIQRDAEDARGRIRLIETSLNGVASTIGDLKQKIEAVFTSVTAEKGNFEKYISETKSSVVTATGSAIAAKDIAITSINNAATQATGALNSAQTLANRYLEQIRTTDQEANSTSADINRIAKDVRPIAKEADVLKLEINNIREIAFLVEDKRIDILDKLHKLLDERPSIDSAAVWKLIVGSKTLLVSFGVTALFLLCLLVWQILLSSKVRRMGNAHD